MKTVAAGTSRPGRRQVSRWRRLAPLAYFAAALVLLDLLVCRSHRRWERYDPDEFLTRIDNCRLQQPDALFVGGSPVSEGVDTAALEGLNWRGQRCRLVYNLGLPGGTTSDLVHAVQRAATHPPRVIFYGVTASDMNERRNDPYGPKTLMSWSDYARYLGYRPRQRWWVTRQFFRGRVARLPGPYRHRNGIRRWALHRLADWLPSLDCPGQEIHEQLSRDDQLRVRHGYAPHALYRDTRLDWRKADGWKPDFAFLHNYSVGSHLRYLDLLHEWCQDHGTELILVDMPVSDDLERRYFSAEMALYRETIRDYARRNRLTLLEAHREEVGLTEADYADLIHLNRHGARRLAEWLRPRLEQLP